MMQGLLIHKKVILMAGPTAVGKTSAAIQVAGELGASIISSDSRQCYKELNIGVARPSPEQLSAMPHYFIASHSIQQEVNAVTFEQYALQKVQELHSQNDYVVMVGGTGLYMRAFEQGFDEMPDIPASVRDAVISKYQQEGLQALQEELEEKDPVFFAEGEMKNPQRVMRALEVVLATGRSITDFRMGNKSTRDFQVIKIGLDLPKEELHRNIAHRVDEMIEQGLLAEVSSLFPWMHLNALQTVGYKEIFSHLQGEISLEKAVELIKLHTRQYAKRQLTWFRKDASFTWFHPRDIDGMLAFINRR